MTARSASTSTGSARPGCRAMTECAAPRGSQRWLQLVVNRCPKLIDNAIGEAIGLGQGETIEWLSPLESDCFREYQDQAFLDRLCNRPRHRQLNDFWPQRGPVWDGLAKTSCGRSLLIEAKANIPEFDSSPTDASLKSRRKIEDALQETRGFLRITSKTDWTKCFYQYANRLAHLYYLKGAKQDRHRLGVRLLCRRQDCAAGGSLFRRKAGRLP